MTNAFTLQDLKEVVSLLEKEKIEYLVIGGFGYDGLIGKLTRKHDDLDIVLNCTGEKALETLSKIGYKLKTGMNELLEFRKNGKKIDAGMVRELDGFYSFSGKLGTINLSLNDFYKANIRNLEGVLFRGGSPKILYDWNHPVIDDSLKQVIDHFENKRESLN